MLWVKRTDPDPWGPWQAKRVWLHRSDEFKIPKLFGGGWGGHCILAAAGLQWLDDGLFQRIGRGLAGIDMASAPGKAPSHLYTKLDSRHNPKRGVSPLGWLISEVAAYIQAEAREIAWNRFYWSLNGTYPPEISSMAMVHISHFDAFPDQPPFLGGFPWISHCNVWLPDGIHKYPTQTSRIATTLRSHFLGGSRTCILCENQCAI